MKKQFNELLILLILFLIFGFNVNAELLKPSQDFRNKDSKTDVINLKNIFSSNNTQKKQSINYQKNFLKIKTLDNEYFDLSQNQGKLVIIIFWARWCSVCKKQMIDLDKFYSKYKNIEIIGLSIDSSEYLNQVKKIAKNYSFKNALYEDVIQSSFKEPKSIPYSYIIKNGEIVKTMTGRVSANELEMVISNIPN
jgi:cytochrome c biogenesis protein CcmG/thiol:disulfide interchange protein DsbE